ncbi:glycogen synthase GlgA [Haliangium sp.]|uniref:glycogen synthase GlgA n=1 Tax=Haliangium sp. TaxID=2663208 RepID=UPI003D143E39
MATAPLKILFTASECVPFIKTGGLADVVAALARALHLLGHDVRIVLPRFGHIPFAGVVQHEAPMRVPMGADGMWCAIWETRLPGSDVPVYMLDRQDLFARGYIYDPPGGKAADNLTRFTFLSRGSLQVCHHLGWHPDVIHCHDWQTALVPVYLNTLERDGPLGRAASVLTIHNLAYQGKFPMHDYAVTGLPTSELRADGLECLGEVNVMQGGLYHATKITTVSPHYAWEIRTPDGGAGLHRVLDFRGADLIGIMNGIDDEAWNPTSDSKIAAPYSVDDLSGKQLCKASLQREMYLDERPDIPLIGAVSRIDWIKGTDMVIDAIDRIIGLGAELVILGSGDLALEQALRQRSDRSADRFRAWIGFDDTLAHRIEAGADFFLMPSRAEPCGLNQLYSQRYGTLPIVRGVGGLEDSVEQYDPASASGTGFKFYDLSVDALVHTVAWAVETWWRHPEHIHAMRQRSMRKPMGWEPSARRYQDVYGWAIEARGGDDGGHEVRALGRS